MVINPYKQLSIYSEKVMSFYKDEARELPPHIFDVANIAYQRMVKGRSKRVI